MPSHHGSVHGYTVPGYPMAPANQHMLGQVGHFRLQSPRHQLNTHRFLGVFTATHLSICLLVAGFGLFVIGLMTVAGVNLLYGDDAKMDDAKSTFRSVGITLLVFGVVFIILSLGIFITAVRWARRRVIQLEPQPMQGIVIPTSESSSMMAVPQQNMVGLPSTAIPPSVLAARRVSVPGSTVEIPADIWTATEQNQYNLYGQAMYPINPSYANPSAPSQEIYNNNNDQELNSQK